MACSEVAAFLQTAGEHYISNVSSQCHNSSVFAARQIANNMSPIAKKILPLFFGLFHNIEDTRFEAKAKVESRTQGLRPRPRTQKKSEAKAKDSPSEDRPSRGQGHRRKCSQKKSHQIFFSGNLQKKTSSKNFFWQCTKF